MWEVVAKEKTSGKEFRRVVVQWSKANDMARKATSKGYRVSLKRYFTDVLVVDPLSGDFTLVAHKMPVIDASRFSSVWARSSRESGCVLWPHGAAMPSTWRVVRAE